MKSSDLEAFVAQLNFVRRAHVVKERRLYYGETVAQAEANYETLVLDPGGDLASVVRTSSRPQWTGQRAHYGDRFFCGTEFYIRKASGQVYVLHTNGVLLRRGNVNDTAYWQHNFRPHSTLDKWRHVEPHSLCEFRKSERMRRLSKLKPYEL